MRESNYWLRTIYSFSVEYCDVDELKYLIDESNQMRKILATIFNKVSAN